jgi:hypothetical protein
VLSSKNIVMDNLIDVSLKDIYNKYSGNLLKVTLADEKIVYGKFIVLNYSPSLTEIFPDNNPTSIGFDSYEKYANTGKENIADCKSITLRKGDIRLVEIIKLPG